MLCLVSAPGFRHISTSGLAVNGRQRLLLAVFALLNARLSFVDQWRAFSKIGRRHILVLPVCLSDCQYCFTANQVSGLYWAPTHWGPKSVKFVGETPVTLHRPPDVQKFATALLQLWPPYFYFQFRRGRRIDSRDAFVDVADTSGVAWTRLWPRSGVFRPFHAYCLSTGPCWTMADFENRRTIGLKLSTLLEMVHL